MINIMVFFTLLKFSVYNPFGSKVLLITNGIRMLIFICDVCAVCNKGYNRCGLMLLKLYFYISLKNYVQLRIGNMDKQGDGELNFNP